MDLRLHLQNDLVRRCKNNPRYSLRAYAKALHVDPSLLSKILSNKRVISRKMTEALKECLGVSPQEAIEQEEIYQELTLDHFHLISDWYHFAIFELVTVKDFDSSPRWMAKALGISISEAKVAIERLIRLGLLRVKRGGKLERTTDHITTIGNKFTAAAFRNLQKQVLKGALEALEEIPFEVRDQTSLTVAVNIKRLSEIKEKIKRFRREICRFVESDKVRGQVYQLGISFYPVTKNLK